MRLLTFIFLVGLMNFSFAQEEDKKKDKKYNNLPAIGAGVGVASFDGDVGSSSPITAFSSFRLGYFGSIEQRFGGLIGLQASGLYGYVSQNEHSVVLNRNFESSLMGGEVTLNFYFDHVFTDKQRSFTPFFGAGAGYYMFDPYGDLTDANGTAYHYWEDGIIRNLPESEENLAVADTLFRDYTYETKLTNDSVNYERSTLAFPIRAGLRFQLSHNLSANLSATYFITQTDYIDNVSEGNTTDAFLTGKVTLMYHFGGYNNSSNPVFDEVDFKSVDKSDIDNDGVPNHKDDCPATPDSAKVDRKGCPIDTDEDGVPDYMDLDNKTPKDSLVGHDGTLFNPESQKALYIDSLVTDRDRIKQEYPSLYGILVSDQNYPDAGSLGDDFTNSEEELAKAEKIKQQQANAANSNIPARFREADTNGDGEISTTEIYGTIDAFFEGSISMTIDDIYALIDFFFEQ